MKNISPVKNSPLAKPHRDRALSRRQMLKLSAGSLLALGLWRGAVGAENEVKVEDFCFIAVNDLHYIEEQCGKWLETALAKMMACSPKPELCVVSGDLTDDGTVPQLTAIRELFKKHDLPLYGVIGNHDWRTQTDRQPYDDIFPGRINYHFDHRGWQFVALDTTEGLKATKTNIAPDTLRWLDEHLPKLDKKRPLILVSHFPLGPKAKNRPLNADALLERFKEHNLRAAFCGHYHAFTETKVGEAVFTTNKCCSFKRFNHDTSKEKGFFFCQIKDGQLSRSFVEVPVPAAPLGQ
jgi:Icc-related predicted phosphoesterase